MSKIEDRPAPKAAKSSPAPSNVVGLMAALQASIDRADSGTATTGQPETRTKKAAAKKTAKAPAKKTVKKTTAKKHRRRSPR